MVWLNLFYFFNDLWIFCKYLIEIITIFIWFDLVYLVNGISTPCPVSWGCRIHRLHLCRGPTPPNKCPRYDTKQSDGEVPLTLDLWEMWSTPSLPSLLGPLWLRMVAPDRVLSMGQKELFWYLNCILMLNWAAWNRTVLTCKLRTNVKLNCSKYNFLKHFNCTYTKLNSLKQNCFDI